MIVLNYRNITISLRESLFWDVDLWKIDPAVSQLLIIERVLSRGNMDEFRQLIKFYTNEELSDSVVKIGYLDDRTLNFISKYLKIPKKILNVIPRNSQC
jgi:hypothetical protein